MDLKFSFGGASPDHQHDGGGAPSGIPLPFTTVAAARSSVLEVVIRRSGEARGVVVAEAVSGDGVTYARAEVDAHDGRDPQALARAVRSALSRAVAELDGPLAESVTGIVVELGDEGVDVLLALGIDPAAPTVDVALQRRTGVSEGTVIRTAA